MERDTPAARPPSSLHPVVHPGKHHRAAAWLGLLLVVWWAVGVWLVAASR